MAVIADAAASTSSIVLPDSLWMPTHRARSIPGVARALAIYAGMMMQSPMDAYRSGELLPRPRILEQPDPASSYAWWVEQNVTDYLLHGNAVALITARLETGWPAAAVWIPAPWVSVWDDPERPFVPRYFIRGNEVDARDIVHVRRGADPWCPVRGMGVIEQHVRSLERAWLEEEYEARTLSDSAIPSIAVITANPSLGEDEATTAKAKWKELFGNPATREPGVFPAGTVIQPLSWSPSDAQLTEARKLTLVDIGNIFNLDPFWLGGESSSLTYKSPGPMYTHLIRVSLGPVMRQFEEAWQAQLLPRGQTIGFDRNAVLRGDLATMVGTLTQAISGGLLTVDEARTLLGYPAVGADQLKDVTSAQPAPAAVSAPIPEPVASEEESEDEAQ